MELGTIYSGEVSSPDGNTALARQDSHGRVWLSPGDTVTALSSPVVGSVRAHARCRSGDGRADH